MNKTFVVVTDMMLIRQIHGMIADSVDVIAEYVNYLAFDFGIGKKKLEDGWQQQVLKKKKSFVVARGNSEIVVVEENLTDILREGHRDRRIGRSRSNN